MKADSCRSTDVTSKTAKRQSVQWHRPMQDFVYGEDFCPFTEEPTGSEIRRYHHGNFFSISCVANRNRRRKSNAPPPPVKLRRVDFVKESCSTIFRLE